MFNAKKEIITNNPKPTFANEEKAHQAKLRKANELLAKTDLSGLNDLRSRKR